MANLYEELYFQTYIDEFARMAVNLLMRNKNQTMHNLERYIAFMSNKRYEVQTLRTDQGTEHESWEIKNHLDMNGISHAITGRSVHSQIHVSGRKNRTISEMAMNMIKDAGLQKQ